MLRGNCFRGISAYKSTIYSELLSLSSVFFELFVVSATSSEGFCMKFCTLIRTPDVITYANFGDDRLRCLGVAGIKFLHSPQGYVVVLKNTRQLPRPCVIYSASAADTGGRTKGSVVEMVRTSE